MKERLDPDDPMKRSSKRNTRQELLTLLKLHPTHTPDQLAKILGISSARVRKLASDLHHRWVLRGTWEEV